MAINYTNPSGGFNLETQGGIGSGVGSPSTTDMVGFIQQMALRRMAQQEQDRARAQQLQDQALHEHEEDRQNAARSVNPADDLRMKNLAESDAIAQHQAMTGVAPTKLISGPQIIPGYVSDPSQMNAYQRKAFLPSNADASKVDINAPSPGNEFTTGHTGGYDPFAPIAQGPDTRADYSGLGSYGKYAMTSDEEAAARRRGGQQGGK